MRVFIIFYYWQSYENGWFGLTLDTFMKTISTLFCCNSILTFWGWWTQLIGIPGISCVLSWERTYGPKLWATCYHSHPSFEPFVWCWPCHPPDPQKVSETVTCLSGDTKHRWFSLRHDSIPRNVNPHFANPLGRLVIEVVPYGTILEADEVTFLGHRSVGADDGFYGLLGARPWRLVTMIPDGLPDGLSDGFQGKLRDIIETLS